MCYVCVVFISSLGFVHLKLRLVVEFFLSSLFKPPSFNRGVFRMIHTYIDIMCVCVCVRGGTLIPISVTCDIYVYMHSMCMAEREWVIYRHIAYGDIGQPARVGSLLLLCDFQD